MPVPSTLSDLSATAASNSPAGSDSIGTSLDDYLRSVQAILKQSVSKGSDITSGSTITVSADANYFVVTGSTTITAINDSWNGRVVVLKFSGTPQLTHSSGLILPGATNIACAVGDVLAFVNESTGVWRCVSYTSSGFIKTSAIGVTVQAYDVDTAKTDVAQTFTISQRGTVTTDNDGSFDMAVTNNFKCTPTAGFTLTFTNITAGQSGFILLVNGSNYAIAAAATTKVDSSFLALVSATGSYLISYMSDGTNVYCVASKALA